MGLLLAADLSMPTVEELTNGGGKNRSNRTIADADLHKTYQDAIMASACGVRSANFVL